MQFPAVINRRRMDDPLDFGHRYRLRGGGWPADRPGTDAAPAGDRPAAGGLYQSGPRDAAGDAGAISVPFLPTMGINLDKNVAAIVALTLNTSAFNAEIWRNAFRTFPREQREAAESVGMRRWTYFRYIMLPQMWIESLPALVNEMSF